MQSFSVIEKLDIPENICPYFFYCSVLLSINQLSLQCRKEAFCRRIVIRTSWRTHRRDDLIMAQHTAVGLAAVLAATVAVKDQSFSGSVPCDCIGQGPFAQLAVDIPAYFISAHFLVLEIQHGRQIYPPRICCNVGYIACPYLNKSIRRKSTVYFISAVFEKRKPFQLFRHLTFIPVSALDKLWLRNRKCFLREAFSSEESKRRERK